MLVSTGPSEPLHDWFHLLARMDLLRQDRLIGGAVRVAGLLSMGLAVAWGGLDGEVDAETRGGRPMDFPLKQEAAQAPEGPRRFTRQ